MRASERIRRLAWATGAMMIGTVLVLGTVILINRYSNSLDETRSEATSQIALERKKPPPDQDIQKPKPKPPPRKSRRAPPSPHRARARADSRALMMSFKMRATHRRSSQAGASLPGHRKLPRSP